jgi:hypothetical protein
MPPRGRDQRSTVDQLRDDIDHGRTSDKVAAPDPATAPLGTDDEAGGTRLDPALVHEMRQRELALGQPKSRSRLTNIMAVWLVLTAVIVIVVALAWMLAAHF